MLNARAIKSLAILGVAGLAALIVFLQATRALPIVDFTYQLANGYRLSLGQLPYVDFDLVLTPGTYYLIKWVQNLFGPQYINQIALVAFTQFLTVLLTFRILNRFSGNQWLTLPLCGLCALTGFGIYPHPSYDIFSVFFILLSISFAQALLNGNKNPRHFFLLGALICLPFLFKQNVGAIYIASMFPALWLTIHFSDHGSKKAELTWLLTGVLFSFAAFIGWLYSFAAFSDFYNQVFVHAGKTRNVFDRALALAASYFELKYLPFYLPVVAIFAALAAKYFQGKLRLQKTYPNFLVSTVPQYLFLGSIVVTFFLTPIAGYILSERFRRIIETDLLRYFSGVWPLIITLSAICFIIQVKKRELSQNLFELLLPIPVILTANAAFLSQGFYGSSYSLWPLWSVLLVIIFNCLSKAKAINHLPHGILLMIFGMIGVHAGSDYNNTRLEFVNLSGEPGTSRHPYLNHLSTPGSWFPDLDKVVDFIENSVPQEDKFLSIPGEDPLHYLTGRVPPLRYFQFNKITLVRDLDGVQEDILGANIKWLFVKPTTQAPGAFIDYEVLLNSLKLNYRLVETIGGYEIYKRVK